MRYTTIIDISSLPAVYRNVNARLIYLHLALTSGYHDDDRDIADVSIRNLTAAVGISFSATRHALAQLEKAQLIRREGNTWIVKKWLPMEKPSARPKVTRQQLDAAAVEAAQREKEERKEARERQRREEVKAQGKTEFMLYYESLQAKADAGDQEAARLLVRHRATYEAHKKQLESQPKTA